MLADKDGDLLHAMLEAAAIYAKADESPRDRLQGVLFAFIQHILASGEQERDGETLLLLSEALEGFAQLSRGITEPMMKPEGKAGPRAKRTQQKREHIITACVDYIRQRDACGDITATGTLAALAHQAGMADLSDARIKTALNGTRDRVRKHDTVNLRVRVASEPELQRALMALRRLPDTPRKKSDTPTGTRRRKKAGE